MGSFRIVTGSGYGRQEFSGINSEIGFKNLRRKSELKIIYHERAIKGWITRRKNRYNDRLWNEYVRKCRMWAEETVAEIKTTLDTEDISDTGNLRDSIGIVKEIYNRDEGIINIEVGVRLGSGPGQIKSPPFWLPSPKYGRLKGEHEGEREMPDEDYSKYVIGRAKNHGKPAKHGKLFESISKTSGGEVHFARFGTPAIRKRITAIALQNAKKIIKGRL